MGTGILKVENKRKWSLMQRIVFAAKIKPGMENEFRKELGNKWNSIKQFLDDNKISNFSIWKMSDLIFIYGEANDDYSISQKNIDRINNILSDATYTFSWLSRPGQRMKLVYYDFGIIREKKDLIRHRVFCAKLKEGCMGEYKRRHDVLIENRKDINYGPESNYTIWSDENYIFGYEEIDTTMEKEMTQEQIEYSRIWENKMLEVMEWVTDDIDWITETRKAKSICLANYK